MMKLLGLLKANPMIAGLIGLLIIGAIVAAVTIYNRESDKGDAVLVNTGVLTERTVSQGKVIEDVKQSQDAVAAPTVVERQRVCSKYDRNCANSQ